MKSGDMQNHDYHETMRSSLVYMKTADLEQKPGENEMASDSDQDYITSKSVSKKAEVKGIKDEQEEQKHFLKPDQKKEEKENLESDAKENLKTPKKDRKQGSSR